MRIEIRKGDFTTSREVWVGDLDAKTTEYLMMTGLKNIPTISPTDMVQDGANVLVSLPVESVMRWALETVLTQAMNGVKREDYSAPEFAMTANAAIDKKLTGLRNGEVRVGGGQNGRITDEVMQRAILICVPRAKIMLGKGAEAKDVRTKAIELVKQGGDKYLAIARARMAEDAALNADVETPSELAADELAEAAE